jgi:drug/metabolite transporter (DMT)-like permease
VEPLTLAYLMILASGACHAVVNAVLKSGGDKMAGRALIDGSSAVMMLPVLFFVPLPTGAWGWLAASAVIHLVYLYALVRAFEAADFSAAYPIARGVAPAVTAAVSVGLLGEDVSARQIAGVACISVGVLLMTVGRHISRPALGWSLLTGMSIAAYTVVDANGVRAAPSALSYIAWVFVLLGFGIAAVFVGIRGPGIFAAAREQWRPGVVAGALSIVTYGLALGAYRMGPVATLAALRETSILFGVVIAVVWLREKVTVARAGAAGVIAVGAGLILA